MGKSRLTVPRSLSYCPNSCKRVHVVRKYSSRVTGREGPSQALQLAENRWSLQNNVCCLLDAIFGSLNHWFWLKGALGRDCLEQY